MKEAERLARLRAVQARLESLWRVLESDGKFPAEVRAIWKRKQAALERTEDRLLRLGRQRREKAVP